MAGPKAEDNSMARIVEDKRRFPVLARSLVIVLILGLGAGANDDGDGPELTPPANMPAGAKPATPARPRTAPTTAPSTGSRAVLALPGITTPSSRTPGVITSTPATSAEPLAAPGDLTLDSPLEMRGVVPPTRPRSFPANESRSGPIPLDPLPMDEFPLPGNTSSRRPTAPPSRPDPIPPPIRRNRFFGLVPGAPVAAPAPRSTTPGRSVAERPADEPKIESALKTRIEKQARQAVGDRVRSVEVHVEGKNVSILARGARFYQKRAVRKSLESLPALSGLRSTIDVVD